MSYFSLYHNYMSCKLQILDPSHPAIIEFARVGGLSSSKSQLREITICGWCSSTPSSQLQTDWDHFIASIAGQISDTEGCWIRILLLQPEMILHSFYHEKSKLHTTKKGWIPRYGGIVLLCSIILSFGSGSWVTLLLHGGAIWWIILSCLSCSG